MHHRGIEGRNEMWLDARGQPLRVQLSQLSDDPDEIDAMMATYREFNLAHHDSLARPYDGVAAEVRALREGGKTLGLVTSKLHDAALRGLRLLELDDCFDFVV